MTTKAYEFFIVDPPTYLKAKIAADKGFKDAQLTLIMIDRTLNAMRKSPMECLCSDCTTLMDNKDHIPKAFAVCIPMFPEAGCEAVSCAVCDVCVDRPDLHERMIDALRKLCPSATLVQATGPKQ